MANQNTSCSITSLPLEIIDLIITFFDTPYHDSHFREELRGLRQVNRFLSQRAARLLFRDIHVDFKATGPYTDHTLTISSRLRRLRELSESGHAHHVRKLTFIFDDDSIDESEDEWLADTLAIDVPAILSELAYLQCLDICHFPRDSGDGYCGLKLLNAALDGIQDLDHLKTLDISYFMDKPLYLTPSSFHSVMSNLEKFSLSGFCYDPAAGNDGVLDAVAQGQSLRFLRLAGPSSSSCYPRVAVAQPFIHPHAPLRSLALADMNISTRCFQGARSYSCSLRMVGLNYILLDSGTWEEIFTMLQDCPRLSMLRVIHCGYKEKSPYSANTCLRYIGLKTNREEDQEALVRCYEKVEHNGKEFGIPSYYIL